MNEKAYTHFLKGLWMWGRWLWFKTTFKMNQWALWKSISTDQSIPKYMSYPHEKYLVVLAVKAPKIIAFICKWHYIVSLITDNSLDNHTFNTMTIEKEGIINNHRFVYSIKDEDMHLPSLYWIPIAQMSLQTYYIAGSAGCSTIYSISVPNRA